MAGFQPMRSRVGFFTDDSDDIDDWMAQRNAQLAKMLGLPKALADNPLTVLKPKGIRQGQMYELHAKVDRFFNAARIPRDYGGGVWNAKALGIEKYDPLRSILYGAPPATKGAVGGALGLGAGLASDKLDERSPQ